MDLFKYLPTPEPTSFEEAQTINGARSITWTERYRDPGEFEIIAPLSSGLMEFLPLGSLISHMKTYEVMVVENHEITEDQNGDTLIKITGRSLEVILENRIVGMPQVRTNSSISEYILSADYTWNQAVSLINDHIQNEFFPDDMIPNVIAVPGYSWTGIFEARSIRRTQLHGAVIELLNIEDLGIKNIRANAFSVPNGSNTQTNMVIFKGYDKTASVVFSWKAGDLDQTEYLWSDKRLKNSAVVLGRYVNTVYDTVGVTQYNRRSAIVAGDDIDGIYNAPPTGAALTDVINKMQVRARAALESQSRLTITRTDLSATSRYQYRKDFDVGDLVLLDGNFGQIAVMRVVEFAEIQDENGETGHPTLSVPGV